MKLKLKGKVLFAVIIALFLCGLFAGCVETGDNEARNISTESSYWESIINASCLKNGIQGKYDSTERNKFLVDNLNTSAVINLSGTETKGLAQLKTASGNVLVDGGMSGFVKTTDGSIYYTSNSSGDCRVNTNQMGIYYYEVNIRGLEFNLDTDNGKNLENFQTVKISGTESSNKINSIECSENSISGSVGKKGTADFSVGAVCDAKGLNSICFQLKYSGSAKKGYINIKTANYSGLSDYQESNKRSFTIDPSGEEQIITVYFSVLDGYSSAEISGIMFEFEDAKKGDAFEITEVKFGKAKTDTSIPCGFEHTIHAYSDRMISETRILYDKKLSNLSEMGFCYKIPVSGVKKLQFENASGIFYTFEDYNDEDAYYIGFETDEGGIFGIIAENDGVTKLRLEKKNGCYVLSVYADISGEHRSGQDFSFGHRIFIEEGSSFENLSYEAYNERNPLEMKVISQEYEKSGFTYCGYDTKTGSYNFSVDGMNFNVAYQNANNRYYGGQIEIKGDGRKRSFFIFSHGLNGCLEAAAILDENKNMLPISPEVCKNFVGEYEEKYYDPDDTQYGNTIYPLMISDNGTHVHTMLNLYQKWGNFDLKQLSSISFHIGYYHLSTGTTESNCIAPYFVYGRDGWTLPDFRGCSGTMWGGQPQFNSVGRLRFMSVTDEEGSNEAEYVSSNIESTGPVYADIEYSYDLLDGAISYTLRHVEFPQKDENRTYYTLTAVVNKNITINNARENLTLFSFDPRYSFMKSASYKDSNGETAYFDNGSISDGETVITKLSKDSPFVSLYNFEDEGIENFGFIVKNYNITIGGSNYNGCLVMRNSVFYDGSTKLNLLEIGIDRDTVKFKKGDTIQMTFILLPYGVENQTNDDNVHYVIEDSVENPWKIKSVTTGELVEDSYLARVKCLDDVAEFTVTGGRNYNSVRVDGFTKLIRPKIQELVDGEWVDYDYNVTEYDGYQVNYTEDGYFSYSFVVYMEDPSEERTFRVGF